ncbi:MAG TPA: uroporphyrinogen decarboxylase family protein [Clostridia bacterium]|nr:uroporphyrinogen decarboxylase family protein [Clostridia bacterium]
MNHRDRVLMALDHKEPDRCPMQISFTPEFAERVKNEIDIKNNKEYHNPHGGGNDYLLERYIGEDMLLTSVGWANSYYQKEDSYTDEWGIKWKSINYNTKYGEGRYTEIVGHPLADSKNVDIYNSPDPHRTSLYEEPKRVIDLYKNQYYIVGVTVTTIFECAWALRGLERLLMDFIEKPDLADDILKIPFNYHLTAAKKLVNLGVDMIWIGDDMGAQNSMLISPELWRKFFKPKMARFISELKNINPKLKVAYHSDGIIYPIIPDLIEIGLDVLNPVQPQAMDPVKLKDMYGDKLCFWGTIDEQYTLPFGTPGDVKSEVIERIETVGKDGGLIIGPTHHVQLDTPLENFWTMVDSIKTNAIY